MNTIGLASQICDSLEKRGCRSKLIASLIASAFASDEPLIVAIDDAMFLHGYDLQNDANFGIEVAMRIETLQDALSRREASLLFDRAYEDDQLAISLANMIAFDAMTETRKGFTFSINVMRDIRSMLRCSKC